MPVVERAARGRSFSKFREQPKVGRLIELLVCGTLIMITTDAACLSMLLECMQQCPVRTCPVASNLEEKPPVAPVVVRQKTCVVVKPIPDLRRVFELENNTEKSNQDYRAPTHDCTKLTPRNMLDDIDWNDRGEDADPTRKKNNVMDEEVTMNIEDVLRDLAMHKAQDIAETLFSDNFAFTHKVMFNSNLFKSSY